MLVRAKVCDLTEDLLWFVCGLYVGILTSSLSLWEPCKCKVQGIGSRFERVNVQSGDPAPHIVLVDLTHSARL